MASYLLDTNVALRLADLASPQNTLVTEAVARLLEQQHVCYLSPQVLTELWVVATRPTDVNGLGWSAARTTEENSQLMDGFLTEGRAGVYWPELDEDTSLKNINILLGQPSGESQTSLQQWLDCR